MKQNLLSVLLKKTNTWSIIFWRRCRFLFVKKRILSGDFLTIHYDATFSNSLIKIDFYFKNLIFLSVPEIDKKLYNGTVFLNAIHVQFPLSVKVVTGNGVYHYTIESKADPHILNSDRFIVETLDLKNIEYNYFEIFDQHAIHKRMSNAGIFGLFQKSHVHFKKEKIKFKKEKISIHHSQFKINENL